MNGDGDVYALLCGVCEARQYWRRWRETGFAYWSAKSFLFSLQQDKLISSMTCTSSLSLASTGADVPDILLRPYDSMSRMVQHTFSVLAGWQDVALLCFDL